MTLVKWAKDEDLFPSFFDDFFGRDLLRGVARGTSTPAVNISETDDSYLVEVAAPGLAREDFRVNLDNHLLTISAEKKDEFSSDGDGNSSNANGNGNNSNGNGHTAHRNRTITRKEFSFTSFQRSFTLPEAVDPNQIQATYTNGILTLTLPKREEARKQPPREIPIN